MPDERMKFTPEKKLMHADEIVEIAKIFTGLGIQKIRITGGEPLIRKDIPEILRSLSRLPVELSLTTNATQIHNFVDVLKECNVNALNVSLDTFDKDRFFQLTRRDEFQRVMDNLQALIDGGFKLKLNVVVMRNCNEHEIPAFIEFTKNHPVDVRFIEYMPFPGNNWTKEQVVSKQEILESIQTQFIVEKVIDPLNSTSSGYSIPGFHGSFGIISTVTAPFCGNCNRLRLTADGKMKNCLFSKGEIDLLTALRKGEEIEALIYESVEGKKKAFGGQDLFKSTENRSMIAIGG